MKELEIVSKGQENQYRNGPRAGTLIMFTEKMKSKNRLKSILILERINHFSV